MCGMEYGDRVRVFVNFFFLQCFDVLFPSILLLKPRHVHENPNAKIFTELPTWKKVGVYSLTDGKIMLIICANKIYGIMCILFNLSSYLQYPCLNVHLRKNFVCLCGFFSGWIFLKRKQQKERKREMIKTEIPEQKPKRNCLHSTIFTLIIKPHIVKSIK